MPKSKPKRRQRDWVSREGHFGELSATALWTDKQAKMIREYRAAGFTFSDLRKLFGGSEGTLMKLCYGKTYRTAGGPIAGVDYLKHLRGKSLL